MAEERDKEIKQMKESGLKNTSNNVILAAEEVNKKEKEEVDLNDEVNEDMIQDQRLKCPNYLLSKEHKERLDEFEKKRRATDNCDVVTVLEDNKQFQYVEDHFQCEKKKARFEGDINYCKEETLFNDKKIVPFFNAQSEEAINNSVGQTTQKNEDLLARTSKEGNKYVQVPYKHETSLKFPTEKTEMNDSKDKYSITDEMLLDLLEKKVEMNDCDDEFSKKNETFLRRLITEKAEMNDCDDEFSKGNEKLLRLLIEKAEMNDCDDEFSKGNEKLLRLLTEKVEMNNRDDEFSKKNETLLRLLTEKVEMNNCDDEFSKKNETLLRLLTEKVKMDNCDDEFSKKLLSLIELKARKEEENECQEESKLF